MLKNLASVTVAALILTMLVPAAANAAPILTSIEIYNTWSSPVNVSSPTFTFQGTAGYTASQNASLQINGIAAIAAPSPYTINAVAVYESSNGVDTGEGGVLADRVNPEISVWDDAGLIAEGVDTDLNADFDNNTTARLLVAIPALGFTTLIVAEDAGRDSFELFWCADAACLAGETQLLNGFNGAGAAAVIAAGFGSDDSGSDIDQAFVFNFQEAVTGYFGFRQTFNPAGEPLEIDFIGGTLGPSQVPEPASIVLFGTGLLGLAAWGRKQRKA